MWYIFSKYSIEISVISLSKVDEEEVILIFKLRTICVSNSETHEDESKF